MRNIWKIFEHLYNKKIDGRGLSIFRIAFTIILFFEVFQLFYFRHLIFDVIPYIESYEIAVYPIFIFWFLALLFLLLGFFTKTAAIINYLLTVILLGTTSSYEYHMFYSYLTVSFLFIFLPISKNFSVDRFIAFGGSSAKPQKVSILCYYLPVFIGVGFVYVDSIFFKLTSSLWMNGLGMWKPASMPQSAFMNITPLLNFKYLILALGYLTFLFETIFIFTFWRKSWRVYLLIIGIGLHLGILICFPITFFALGVSSIYLLMVPVKFWKIIFDSKVVRLISNRLNLFLIYLFESSKIFTDLLFKKDYRYNSGIIVIRNKVYKKLSFYGIIIISGIQLIVSFNSPLWKNTRELLMVEDHIVIKKTENAIKLMTSVTRDFLGITNHGVFMNSHFENYNHSIAVVYKPENGEDVWLPLTNEKGTPSNYLFGPIWIKWTFRANNPNIDQEVLKESIRDFTAFWAHKEEVDLDNATFSIKVKKNRVPHEWEKDFLNNQLSNPWIEAGFVTWKNEEFYPNIKEIEKL